MSTKTWADKIAALENAGWTLTRIARSIGLSVQAACDIKQGRVIEPRGMAAVRLHKLAERTRRRKPRKAA
jgi:hypothetical protein